jgi:sugar-specific transcriptional regulator TrmB
MQKDLVIKLSEFGFTTNQAKVYLCIIESGVISVGKIAQTTQLHVQDIYKILPKLEKMGLITKTLQKPVQIKAIPIEKALTHLVTVEKENAQKRIRYLESNLQDLVDSIKESPLVELPEDSCFIPLITAKQIKNQADLTFTKACLSCDLVINVDLLKPLMSRLAQNFKHLNVCAVKTRVIIESPLTVEEVKLAVHKVVPKTIRITIKQVHKTKPVPYYVIDQNEAWVSMEKETEAGLPCVLWTNGKNIVNIFQEFFNDAWNKPSAVNIYSQQELQEIPQTITP